MAAETDELSAGASLQANPNKSIAPTSDNPDRFEDSAVSPPSTVISEPDGRKKDDGDSKVSALPSETTATASDTEKKIRRAERFGINVKLSEQEKRNSRAERFGTAAGSGTSSAAAAAAATSFTAGSGTSPAANSSEELKRKARAERFGLPVTVDEDSKKKARVQRFAPTSKTDVVEEDKKRARELRFSQPSNALSLNGKGDIEPKAAIAGKAGGGA